MRPDGDPASIFTVCPGEHRVGPPDADFSVVWWAPDELGLGVQACGELAAFVSGDRPGVSRRADEFELNKVQYARQTP